MRETPSRHTPSTEPGVTLAVRASDAPLGCLRLASALAITGLGSIGAALYLAVDERSLTLWAVGLAAAIAPASLYLAYHLLCLTRWAWLAAVAMIALLLVSSAFRFLIDPEIPGAAGLEMALEVAALAYLTRPRVRRAFARSPPT